jgi:hypothetical protein
MIKATSIKITVKYERFTRRKNEIEGQQNDFQNKIPKLIFLKKKTKSAFNLSK